PAILVEGGFMDSTIDIKKMRDDKVLDTAGKAVAEGAVEYFGLKKKESKPSTDTPKLGSTFHVKKETDGYYTAADAKAGKNKRTAVKAGVYYVFNTANGMINVTTKNGTPGSWINPNAKSNQSKQKEDDKTILIRIKATELWYYDKPDWNAKKYTVKRGDLFTVVDRLYVNLSKMYMQ